MIHRETQILDWDIEWYFFTTKENIDDILSSLVSMNAQDSLLSKIERTNLLDKQNYGFTFSNMSRRKSIVVIGQTTSGQEFLNTFIHELRHLTDHIASTLHLDLSGEEVAYLAGDVAMTVGDIICKYSCDSCKNKN